MDIVLILLLILLNGVFAMSEIAVVSSRKTRLQSLAESGSPGARAALSLHQEPNYFLSTVQVGITTVGILSGAVGERSVADPLGEWLGQMPLLAPYARAISLTVVVIGLTYFSVVVGELVPKRLGLLAPEGIASTVARPMMWLSGLAKPLVWLFSASSDVLLRIIGARRKDEPPVTNEEIKVLMEQGAEAGVFHESEQNLVSNVLRLDEQRIRVIMTPRKDIYAIDLDEDEADIRRQVAECPYGRVVVCRDGVDNVVGVLKTGDLLKRAISGQSLGASDVEGVLKPPLYVPETVTTTQLLENFRQSRVQFALIVDEYGELQGLVTLTDVLTAIVGEIDIPSALEEQDMVQREDGSWLIDGGVTVERLKAVLDIDDELPDEDDNEYNTVGGFVMHTLGRLPVAADYFDCVGLRFEVMDMDRTRVDKVMVSRLPEAGTPAEPI